jgi:hypothetical protein
MAKYLLLSDEYASVFTTKVKVPDEAKLLEVVQRDQPDKGWKSCTYIPRGHHVCKYCWTNIVDSPDEDVLCEECRGTFGHAFYSEL